MNKPLCGLVFAGCAFGAAFLPQAARAEMAFRWIPPLEGETFASPLGVSEDGRFIVGFSGFSAVRWDNGVPMSLGALPDRPSGHGWAVTPDGAVVVGVSENLSGLSMQGFRWNNGSIAPLPYARSSDADSEAYALSDDGRVVVGHSGFRPTRWVDGDVNPLPGLTDEVFGAAEDVSADGEIVAGYVEMKGALQPVTWDTTGMNVLPLLNGASAGFLSAVSGDGLTAVGSNTWNSGNAQVATLYRDGMARSLGYLHPDVPYSMAMDVSDDGSLVVGDSATDFGNMPFVWTEEDGMTSLWDLLALAGVDVWNARFLEIRALSGDGRTIIGTGVFDETQRAWQLTLADAPAPVPEPSSYALLGAALLTLLAARHRLRR